MLANEERYIGGIQKRSEKDSEKILENRLKIKRLQKEFGLSMEHADHAIAVGWVKTENHPNSRNQAKTNSGKRRWGGEGAVPTTSDPIGKKGKGLQENSEGKS